MNWAAGIDIGGTKIKLAAVSPDGSLIEVKLFSTNPRSSAQEVEEELISAILELTTHLGSSPTAVGIGIAGQVLPNDGFIKFAPNLGWKNVPMQERLHSRLKIPVKVMNDVRSATWGEWLYGAGKGVKDLFCLFIGTGIGGGIVSGGHLLEGANNSAGEIGHMAIELNGPKCTCGNNGCFEAIAGGWAIAQQCQAAIEADRAAGNAILNLADNQIENVSARHVLTAAQSEDPLALEILDSVTEALIAGSVNIANLFNPSLLIIGGGLGLAIPNLPQLIENGIKKSALNSASDVINVVPAHLGNDAGVIGAVAPFFANCDAIEHV